MRQFKDIEVAGYPVDGTTFAEINTQIQQVAKFCAAVNGDNYIASGVVKINTTTYTSGWIVWNNEVLPFQGGVGGTQVTIIEEAITRTYQDNQQKGHVTNRYAKFGNNGVETFAFSALRPVYSNFANSFLQKVALPFTGALVDMPKGFQLADGSNGTPDMTASFIVGYKSGTGDYNVIGATGGEEKVGLTANQNAPHDHKFKVGNVELDRVIAFTDDPVFPADGSGNDGGTVFNDQGVVIASSGEGEPHENRPPYYVVAYMMWVGF